MAPEASGPLTPAPYGRACVGCARAKCKCFYRSTGADCERCHRLGKQCEPATAVRKRKAETSHSPPPPPTQQPVSRIEEKLDDLMALMRSQAAEKIAHRPPPHSMISDTDVSSTFTGTTPTTTSPDNMPPLAPFQDPDVVINKTSSGVNFFRPSSPDPQRSPIAQDVSRCGVLDMVAEENLAVFRQAFLPIFPFVHLPGTMSAAELRRQKPFLWLVIMALTTRQISQQFHMESIIWNIISQRIVAEHLVDIDLLLGVVCFASWSHYFKKDKPFMSMLSAMAVSLAVELGLQKDTPHNTTQGEKPGHLRNRRRPKSQSRTMEERRTILAVYHVTSATWTQYRKKEPLRWTSYLETCVSILSDKQESELDVHLATQVKCQILANQILLLDVDDPSDGETPRKPPAALMKALLGRLKDLRQGLPPHIQSDRIIQFYLANTELTIQDPLLGKPGTRDKTGFSHFQRLEDLESMLANIEHWLGLFFDMPLLSWTGISVDVFAQFMHCLVVLFRLNTLDEPGWDLAEVRQKADVLNILDRACDMIDLIPPTLQMVDAEGPRSGLFFKTNYLFRAIKTLFLEEMAPNATLETPQVSNLDIDTNKGDMTFGDVSIMDDFLMNLSQEPWMSDILWPTWEA